MGPLEDQLQNTFGERSAYSGFVIEDIAYAVVTDLATEELLLWRSATAMKGGP